MVTSISTNVTTLPARSLGAAVLEPLLASDDDVPAMLLERLGPNLDQLGLSVPQIFDAVTSTLTVTA